MMSSMNEIFTKEDLPDLQDDLFSVREKWYDIGLRIGLTCDDLDPIKAQYNDFVDCLREMLKLRLGKMKALSKKNIVLALRKPSIEKKSLAAKLERQYSLGSESSTEFQENQDSTPSPPVTPTDEVFSIQGLDKDLLPFIQRMTELIGLISKKPDALDCMKTWIGLCAIPGTKIKGAKKLLNAPTVSEFFRELQLSISIIDADIFLEIIKASGCKEAIEHFKVFLKGQDRSMKVLDVAKKWCEFMKQCSSQPIADSSQEHDIVYSAPADAVVVSRQPRITSDLASITAPTNSENPSIEVYNGQKSIIARALDIPSYLLSMFGCRPGSFIITWHVPATLVPHIKLRLKLLSEEDPDSYLPILAQHKILELILNTQDETHKICVPQPSMDTPQTDRTDKILPKTPVIALSAVFQKEKVGANRRLLAACKKGNKKDVKTLLEKGANINAREGDKYKWTPLMWASYKNHRTTVETLLSHPSSDLTIDAQDAEGWTAFALVCKRGHLDIVRLLQEHGANINQQNDEGWNGLMWASISKGSVSVVKHLLASGADTELRDHLDWTALMVASQAGHKEAVQELLTHGANANAQDKKGMCALMSASQRGYLEIVKVLKEHGVNVNMQKKDGVTALHIASYRRRHKVVEELCHTEDVNVNIQDEDESTPLMIASQKGNHDVVKVLLKEKADPNIQAMKALGWTALFMAVKKGKTDVVQTLLQKGADPNIKDENGVTVVDMAEKRKKLYKILLIETGQTIEERKSQREDRLRKLDISLKQIAQWYRLIEDRLLPEKAAKRKFLQSAATASTATAV